MSGGARSNANNNILRRAIFDHIDVQLGVPVFRYSAWLAAGEPDDCVVDGFPYRDFRGQPTADRNDIVLIDPKGLRTRIMPHWQGVAGTTDAKMFKFLENAFASPENYVAILLDGNGWDTSMTDWIVRAAVDRTAQILPTRDKHVKVMLTLPEVTDMLQNMRDQWAERRAALPPTTYGRLL